MQKPITVPIVAPGTQIGQQRNRPEEFLANMVSSYTRNMEFYNGRLQSRYGLTKLINMTLSGPVQTKATLDLTKFGGTRHEIFATTKDIYKADFSNARYDILTPTYSTGKVLFTNGSLKVYGGLEVDNCDDNPVAWADGSGGDVTPSRETTTFQEGTAGVKLTVGAGAGVEILAYHDITSVNLSAYDSIGFWFRSSVNLDAGDLQFLIDNTSACASPLETINFPAITANTWTWVNLAIVTPANLTAVVSIGIKQAVDKGAMNLYIDQIVAGDWADQLAAGDFIKQGSGSVHTGSTWYEIDTVTSDTELTLTAVYAGSTDDQSAYVARHCFTGGDNDFFDWIQFEDVNLGQLLIMTNGVDKPVYWDGTNQFVAFATGYLHTSMTAAKYVSVYAGRLLMAWVVQGGINQPQRIVGWQPYDITSPDEDAFPIDLVDEPTAIVGMGAFRGYHVAFKETNAHIGRYVGGDVVLQYEPSDQCKGVRSAWSVVIKNDFISYYGVDKKFHKWNLLQDDIISEENFPETVQFDPNQDEFVQGYDVTRKNQIRWFCPKGSASQHNYVYVYDYQVGVGLPWEYAQDDACSCMGGILRTSDVYADDPVYGAQYADQTSGYADDSEFLDNGLVTVYGGYDGIVRIADSGGDDDGETFTRLLRLKRLNANMPDWIKRLWRQQWWLEAAVAGSVTVKLLKNDKTDYESGSKTISLIPDNSSQDIVKRNVTWNVHGYNFQPEISSTVFFAVLAVVNYFFPKRTTIRG